ncbi:MAG: exonuclease domain-containing protein [Bacteroidota bacterium]
MFAIVDIETCGGKFEFQKGRIIEIAIVVHDGLSVVKSFSSLINPECYIAPNFTRISGITNEMVADAPKFHEVAKDILEFTEGCVFVAHNVNFDYSFVRDEFASLGYKYRRDTICTVRLSRKFLPGKDSYSLGKLCASLGIEVQNRHRALGDAEATAKLFDILLEVKSTHPVYKNQGAEALMVRRIDKIKQYILNKIPETTGVYYFLNNKQEILYIGKSTNMYNRAINHFNPAENKGKKLLNELYNVDFVETGSELIALLLENKEIKVHKPEFNTRQKADVFTHAIDYFNNEEDILTFKIVAHEEAKQPLLSFTSMAAAREKIEYLLDEFSLCLRYCSLTSEDAVCFNHQIKKCNGICAGEEAVEDYNFRAQKLVSQFTYDNPNFMILGKGRTTEEKSFVLILNQRYAGYGYLIKDQSYSNVEDIRAACIETVYHPDADHIIKSWMSRNKFEVKVF